MPVFEPWIVLKFGGTSVAGRPQWDAIARQVTDRRGKGARVLLVCSAVAGVTDALEMLALPGGRDPGALAAILERHARLAGELGIDAGDILQEGRARIEAALASLESGATHQATARLLALGEWLSTRLGAAFLSRDLDVEWVDAREALRVEPEPDPHSRRAWLSAQCAAGVDSALQTRWSKRAPVLVTQGFIAATAKGQTALLGRGGSDTSAALLGSRLGAERVEIWTDVAGLYSADPAREPDAQLLQRVDYEEALEMAAGGARVIHGRSIRAAADASIPLWIRCTTDPGGVGTRITGEAPARAPGVRAVVVQQAMAVILLRNMDTRQQVGFLAWVFSRVAEQGISVDQVATSETTTTLAIDRAANRLDDAALDTLVETLRQRCHVTPYGACAAVNLVGRGAHRALARLDTLEGFLAERPMLMVSQSAHDLGIALLVHADDAPALASLLHRRLVMDA